jgi:EAL domain-containing protein (putative c-di-GMP-specific phosphodiesterase class I)
MMVQTPAFRKVMQTRRLLEAAGFRFVVDGIDTQQALTRFKDFAPRHAQGKLFAAKTQAARKAA